MYATVNIYMKYIYRLCLQIKWQPHKKNSIIWKLLKESSPTIPVMARRLNFSGVCVTIQKRYTSNSCHCQQIHHFWTWGDRTSSKIRTFCTITCCSFRREISISRAIVLEVKLFLWKPLDILTVLQQIP